MLAETRAQQLLADNNTNLGVFSISGKRRVPQHYDKVKNVWNFAILIYLLMYIISYER